jgi:hypothetical protein
MAKKWCLGCDEWLESVMERIEIGPGRWNRHGARSFPTVEMCPNDDGTASGHLLVDAPPD